MVIFEAIAKQLDALGLPVVTEYRLFLILRELYRAGSLNGEPLRTRRGTPTPDSLNQVLRPLISRDILEADRDFTQGVYRVARHSPRPAEDVCCLVDPFCYIAYLSALQRHSLTDRQPNELHLASPASKLWIALRDEQMQRDFGGVLPTDPVVPLQRIGFADTIRQRPVRRHTVQRPGSWRAVRGGWARVATVGQTFLDTLEFSDLCGGMAHVITVWEEHAGTFLEEIVTAVDGASTKLTKIRAGYLLQERLALGLGDGRIEAWKHLAQRGGSQKLDPGADYVPVFSETWMLSLNV